MFINCKDLFCSFALFINFKMQIGFFSCSSEAEHVLALFLFLGKSSLNVSIKCSDKKRSVYQQNGNSVYQR